MDHTTTPGMLLKQWIADNATTQVEVARRTGLSQAMVNCLANDARGLTDRTAGKLAALTGIPKDVWLAVDGQAREALLNARQALFKGRQLVSIGYASRVAGVHPNTMAGYIRQGRIPTYNVGGSSTRQVDLNELHLLVTDAP